MRWPASVRLSTKDNSDKQDTELTTLCYENKARVMFLYIDSIYR